MPPTRARHQPRHAAAARSQHRRLRRPASRRAPARLTLGVAAATVAGVAAVAGISVGDSQAAAPAGSRTAAPMAVASGAARPAMSAAPAVVSGQGTRQQTQAALAARAARARPAGRPAVRASPSARPSGQASRASSPAPYLIYDSILPQDIPAGQEVATYADGPPAVAAAAVAGRTRVLWIDTVGTDTAAQVIDVEPGDATPSAAASWTYRKLSSQPQADAIIYTSIAEWALVRADISVLPAAMQARIRWWIADPTGVPHVVPGSQATQWYWGPQYDISTATPQF